MVCGDFEVGKNLQAMGPIEATPPPAYPAEATRKVVARQRSAWHVISNVTGGSGMAGVVVATPQAVAYGPYI